MITANVNSAMATPAHHFRETVAPEKAQATALTKVRISTFFNLGITKWKCGYRDTAIQK